MHCPNCGVELLGGMVSCPKCHYDMKIGKVPEEYLQKIKLENQNKARDTILLEKRKAVTFTSEPVEVFSSAKRLDGVIGYDYANNVIIVRKNAAGARIAFGLVGALIAGDGDTFEISVPQIDRLEYGSGQFVKECVILHMKNGTQVNLVAKNMKAVYESIARVLQIENTPLDVGIEAGVRTIAESSAIPTDSGVNFKKGVSWWVIPLGLLIVAILRGCANAML